MSETGTGTGNETPAQTVKCPKCKAVIKLTDAMAAPIRDALLADFDKQLAEERATITREANEAARKNANAVNDRLITDLAAANGIAKEHERKLAESQAETARLLTKERQLDNDKRELELTIAKRVKTEAESIQVEERRNATAAAELRVGEKQVLIDSLTAKIDELQRRADQGDNRVAGEAQELVLEAALRTRFPLDIISPVAKGVYGGDCLQTVIGPSGQVCGSILWESKRTKTWEGKWVGKLRDDMRAAKADLAVIVTQAMPPNVLSFEFIDGVWVGQWSLALAIATVLRYGLLEVAAARVVGEGQATKMEMMYGYLTGPRFKARMQAAVERFNEMLDDLRKERQVTTRLWAKREGQITGAVESIAGFVGDVQGIGGKAVGEIEGLTAVGGIEEEGEGRRVR